MAPNPQSDEDGDILPHSVMATLEEAKNWDLYKNKKYRGKQKARSMVLQYQEQQEIRRKEYRQKRKNEENRVVKSSWNCFTCFDCTKKIDDTRADR
jgi:hypothetical protein